MNSSRTITPFTYDRRTAQVVGRLNTDAITGCTPGCALRSSDVEALLAVKYPVILGSLQFSVLLADDKADVAAFTVKVRDGSTLRGVVRLRAVVERDSVITYSDIRLVTENRD